MKDRNILVDTSAWILSFKRTGHEELKALLKEAIDTKRVVTSPLIILELLQGCRTEKEFDTLKTRLESLENCSIEDLAWEKVYSFSFSLRKKGLTVPTLDIIIAFLSIEKGCTLLHHDHHFRKIAENSNLDAVDFLG